MAVTTQPDPYAQMTQRARAMWALGAFDRAATEQVIVAELLCRATGIHPGERVLDVAQALPFADGAFDVVLSTFGVMFAPDQARAAAELLRVCRPGGRIGLTAWTPGSLMAATQATAARFASFPPVPGARSPIEWGTETRVRELLGPGITELSAQVLTTDLCGTSPAGRVEFNRTYVGPTKAIFDRLDPAAQQTLADELASCLQQFNRATDGTLVASAEYLQVTATRAAPA